jgi:hypothetical protein
MKKETKLEVVSSSVEKVEYRKGLAKKLETKLEEKRKEVAEKKYPINGGLIVAKSLYNFIKTEACWKFTESLGIVESARILEEEIKKLSDKNSENPQLELNAVTIEAIYYFMTKEEKRGLTSALNFINNLLRPISEALVISKNDREEINQMERDLGTLQDAILNRVGFEGEDALLKEIEDQLSKEN